MLRLCFLIANFVTPLAALHAAAHRLSRSPTARSSSRTRARMRRTRRTLRATISGPSITLLPDGRLMAVWFSSPSEGAASQRIVQAFSSDQGRTRARRACCRTLRDALISIRVLFVAGKRDFLSSPPSRRRSTSTSAAASSSAKTWSEPVKPNQPKPHHTLQRHPTPRRTPRAATPARHKSRRRVEIERWRPDLEAIRRSGESRRPRRRADHRGNKIRRDLHDPRASKMANSGAPSVATKAKLGAPQKRPA